MNPYLNQPCRDDACEELLQNFKLHVSGKSSSMPFSIFKRIEIHAELQTVPYWIDSTDIGREGKWVTLSTGKSGYTNWHSRPDNAGGNQHCAFNNFGRHLGRWDDVGCKYPLQVICEASGILFSISCQNCFTHVLKLLLLR